MSDPFTHLDQQLGRYSSKLRDDLRINEADANAVASALHRDCVTLGVEEIRGALREDLIPLSKRKDELVAFQMFMDRVASTPASPPEIIRAQVVVQLYISFVYLRDTMVDAVRRRASPNTTLKRVCKALCDNEVRALRNAVAHGNWTYSDSYDGIRYWASKTEDPSALEEWFMSQEDLTFWQSLSRCTGYVMIETICGV